MHLGESQAQPEHPFPFLMFFLSTPFVLKRRPRTILRLPKLSNAKNSPIPLINRTAERFSVARRASMTRAVISSSTLRSCSWGYLV